MQVYSKEEVDKTFSTKLDLTAMQVELGGAILNMKTELESDLADTLKATADVTATKTELQDGLALKANVATAATKTELQDGLALKANAAMAATKTELQDGLALKANVATAA